MRSDGRRLVIDLGRASTVRALVGPTAWFVLESVAERCPSNGASAELEVNTRQLGEALGLSKDTVARALRRLAAEDLVRRVDRRDAFSGKFAATVYVIDLAAAGVTVEDDRTEATPVGVPRVVRRVPDRSASPRSSLAPERLWDQLDLLS